MTAPIVLFLTLMTLLATAMVLYVANVRFVFRESGRKKGALALVPLATPVLAYRAGGRALPIAFTVVAVLYAIIALGAPS